MVLGSHHCKVGLFDARGAVLILCDHLPSAATLGGRRLVQRLCECASTCLFCVVLLWRVSLVSTLVAVCCL
jgi:hypothetical protein